MKKETAGEELPLLNRFLYLKEDSDRMERKLEEMDSCSTAVPPVPAPVDQKKEHGQDARVTPNEATAGANSRPGQTKDAIANAAAKTVDSLIPSDWPKNKVFPYWEHFPKSK